jgi:hypothetical protein
MNESIINANLLQKLRQINLITETEIVLQSGDLYIVENVLTKERRILTGCENILNESKKILKG